MTGGRQVNASALVILCLAGFGCDGAGGSSADSGAAPSDAATDDGATRADRDAAPDDAATDSSATSDDAAPDGGALDAAATDSGATSVDATTDSGSPPRDAAADRDASPEDASSVDAAGSWSFVPMAAPLAFSVDDVEYSATLDALVVGSAGGPYALHVIGMNGADASVPLPLPPELVSISADGKRAVAIHVGWISYVDLVSLSVLKRCPITAAPMNDAALGPQETVYALSEGESKVYAVRLSDCAEIDVNVTARGMTALKLHPSRSVMYGATGPSSQSSFQAYDVAAPPAKLLSSLSVNARVACDAIWLDAPGNRFLTRCASIIDTAALEANRLSSALVPGSYLSAGAFSSDDAWLVTVPADEYGFLQPRLLQLWRTPSLVKDAELQLGPNGGAPFENLTVRYAFGRADGTFVLLGAPIVKVDGNPREIALTERNVVVSARHK